MTSQQLADRLAELAGWKKRPVDLCLMGATPWYRPASNPRDPGDSQYTHPFPVGSLDALERWRGENLPGEWRWGKIDFWGTVDAMLCYGNPMAMGSKYRVLHGRGPDEWTARAAALIAAKESSMNKDTTAPKGAPPQPKEPKK